MILSSVSPYFAYFSMSYPPIMTLPDISLFLVKKKLKIGLILLCPNTSLLESTYSINEFNLTPLSDFSYPGAKPIMPLN